MKQQVLKALANPARIFYVPYKLAVLNFVVQFIAFIVIFIVTLITTKHDISPLFLIISIVLVHFVLIGVSRKDPQIGQIISAKIQLLKHRIPKRLAA